MVPVHQQGDSDFVAVPGADDVVHATTKIFDVIAASEHAMIGTAGLHAAVVQHFDHHPNPFRFQGISSPPSSPASARYCACVGHDHRDHWAINDVRTGLFQRRA
jgi:hypothetical protein